MSNIEKTKNKTNNIISFNNYYENINKYDFDNENNNVINKGIEINEQIMIMKNDIDKINKYNNLLNEIMKEEIKLNNKIGKDIIIYKDNLLNREEKLKIIEKHSKVVEKALNQIKEKYN